MTLKSKLGHRPVWGLLLLMVLACVTQAPIARAANCVSYVPASIQHPQFTYTTNRTVSGVSEDPIQAPYFFSVPETNTNQRDVPNPYQYAAFVGLDVASVFQSCDGVFGSGSASASNVDGGPENPSFQTQYTAVAADGVLTLTAIGTNNTCPIPDQSVNSSLTCTSALATYTETIVYDIASGTITDTTIGSFTYKATFPFTGSDGNTYTADFTNAGSGSGSTSGQWPMETSAPPDAAASADTTDCGCGRDGESVADPIDPRTGAVTLDVTDYRGSGPFPLQITRHYNSLAFRPWSFDYGDSATFDRRSMILTVNLSNGLTTNFFCSGAVGSSSAQLTACTPNGNVNARVILLTDASGNTTGVTYVQGTGDSETFSFASGTGVLVSLATRAGLTQTLTYDANGNVSSVADQFGRTLTVSYDTNGQLSVITDPAGNVYQYAFDAGGRLIQVRAPDGTTKSYAYLDVPGSKYANRLASVTDELGVVSASWSYDATGRAVSATHPAGAGNVSISYARAGAGSDTTVTDALGRVSSYTYASRTYSSPVPGALSYPSQSERTQSAIQPTPSGGPGASSWTSDANGNPASYTDPAGLQTTYVYDLTRNLETQRTLPDGRVISTTWNPTYRLPASIQLGNRLDTRTYDANGNLLTRTLSDTGTGARRLWQYLYNSVGQVLAATDPDGHVTRYAYDRFGNRASVTDALGHVTSFTYDADGRVIQTTEPNGLVTTQAYDSRGRLISRSVGGLVTTYAYNPIGLVSLVTRPDGSFTQFGYDAVHRLVRKTNNFGASTEYTLDAAGNRVGERQIDSSANLAYSHTYEVNFTNGIADSIGAQGQTTVFVYDNDQNLTGLTDALGQATRYTYDSANRRVSSADPTGAVTRYAYDAFDDVVSVTDARGLTTTYSYDALGDLLATSSPDTGVTRQTFDAVGNVASRADANGRLASYAYDALNRPAQIRYAGATATNFRYDQGVNGIGHLTEMADAAGTTRWTYDRLGRVASKSQLVNRQALAIQYAYDSSGRLVSMTYPSGAVVQLAYSADLVTQISVNGNPVVSNVTYQAYHGPANAWTWGNGTAYQRAFDADARLSSYPLAGRSRSLNFDAGGRVTAYADSDATQSQSFTYDPADRLTSYITPAGSEQYTYDSVGNRLSLVSTLGAGTQQTYGYSATSNQLLDLTGAPATAFAYDATGNTVSDGPNVFVYDGRNRLIEASNAQGLSYYAINGLGQRVAKLRGPPPDLAGDSNNDGVLNVADVRQIVLMAGGVIPVDLAADCNHDGQVTLADATCVLTKIVGMRANPQNYASPTGTSFFYDEAGQLIGEYGANAATIQETIYLGNLPVAVLKGGNLYFIYADQLNAPRMIVDNTNAPVWDWEGSPFGATLPNQDPGAIGNAFVYNLRFPGQYFDAETGLHYNNARDYRPGTGRYVESDPVGLGGGVNTYAYGRSNSVRFVDPTGKTSGETIVNAAKAACVALAICTATPSVPAGPDTPQIEQPAPAQRTLPQAETPDPATDPVTQNATPSAPEDSAPPPPSELPPPPPPPPGTASCAWGGPIAAFLAIILYSSPAGPYTIDEHPPVPSFSNELGGGSMISNRIQ